MTQADRLARVEARKRPEKAAPWHPPIRGTQYWIVVDEVSAAALAAGLVTARVQVQAAQLVSTLTETEG